MTHATGNTTHIPVSISADTTHLSPATKEMLALLVAAAKLVDSIYLKQSDQSLPLEGGLFDATRRKTFYPREASAESLQEYFKEHPEDEATLRNPCTVVVEGSDGLKAIPYSEVYREEMQQISGLLERAALLAEDETLARFLKARSEAFLTNSYRESNILWIYTDGPLEVTIGPFEDYADTLLGVKRAFEAVVGVVLKEETALASTFSSYISEFDAMLGERYGYTTKTTLTPMVVIDEVYGGGESLYDYIPMAYNLPNDPDIHDEVGSKKVFIKNVMREKFNHITLPIAASVLSPHDYHRFDLEVYLQHVIGHEGAHGLTVRFEGEDFGPVASGLEEGKADVFGMWFLYYLVDHGVLPASVAETAVIQNITDGLRQVRFGVKEAHARGSLVQFNWFIVKGALEVTPQGLTYHPELFRKTVESLGDELYRLSETRDGDTAEAFMQMWGNLPVDVAPLLARFTDIPVDIDPIFSV